MGRNRRLSPFLTDFAATVATSVIVTACLLIITRMIATKCGSEELGLYVLFRRVGALLVPTSTFMIGVGLTRALAMSKDMDRSLVWSASLLGLAATTVTCALLFLAAALQTHMSAALQRITAITPALIAFLIANLVFTLAYSWYRGSGQMRRANAWQMLCVGIAPLLVTATFAGHWPIGSLLVAISAAYALPAVALARLARAPAEATPGWIRRQIDDLVRYCLPRIPGSLGLTAILALAPLAAALRLGLTPSGYLGAGQSIFAVSEGGATALSLLLLPKISSLLADGRTSEIRDRVSEMTLFLLQVGLPIAAAIPFFAGEIVRVWLGPQYAPAAKVMLIYCAGLFPYVSYVALRSVLDATEVKALNTVSILTALALQAIALAAAVHFNFSAEFYAATTTLAMAALGAQSFYFVWRQGSLALTRAELAVAAGGVVAVVGPLIAAEAILATHTSLAPAAVTKLALFAAFCAFYLAMLWRSRSRWTLALRRRISPSA